MPTPPTARRRIEISFSWGAIARVVVVVALVALAMALWPLLRLLLLAVLVGITLFPILAWARRRGWPDGVGLGMIVLLLVVIVALLGGILLPTLGRQAAEMAGRLPSFQQEVVPRLPQPLAGAANAFFQSATQGDPGALAQKAMAWGMAAARALGAFLLVLVLAVYLVADGERVGRWLLAFFPRRQRRKARVAGWEFSRVVSAYMRGQLITSALTGVATFAALAALQVPAAALLAVLAAVCDILPLVGFIISLVPAAVVALAVSPTTVLWVVLFYFAFNVVENYLIVPYVYGDQLRLSTLTVLVACLAAGMLEGVVGAIVILPVVAAYPIVERMWLRRRLTPGTVARHSQLDAAAEA